MSFFSDKATQLAELAVTTPWGEAAVVRLIDEPSDSLYVCLFLRGLEYFDFIDPSECEGIEAEAASLLAGLTLEEFEAYPLFN